jgi:hypothetical protein
MNQVIFEGIRCFHDYHSAPLKPITLLVGENSSGKTTFLALTRIAWDVAGGDLSEDIFNEEPFLLGSYDQIASFRGGKAGRAKSFTIGVQVALPQKQKASGLFSENAFITAKFVRSGSDPQLEEWCFESGNFKILAKPSPRSPRVDLTIITPNGIREIKGEDIMHRGWLSVNRVLSNLPFFLSREFRSPDENDNQLPVISEGELRELQGIARQIPRSLEQRPYAFAPIRTRPRRTYDPLKDVPEPEGSHVPMVLARILNSIEVKRKGYKESDPFQIGVKTIGPTFNLVDVGYGVSQVLPIVVDVVQNPKDSTFLLQQPEVHLHPKAQAELGSFLAALAKEQNKRFIIETHSDYLIDRIRMDIRDKKYISPDDVIILYFEKVLGGVNIYELSIDEFGNIINAPPTYRQFFLEEERRMLGI